MNESPHGKWQITDISPSKLKTWKDCSMKFYYNYVRKAPKTSGLAALQGSALHMVALDEYITKDSPYTLLNEEIRELRKRIDAGENIVYDDDGIPCLNLEADLTNKLKESDENINDLLDLLVMDLEARMETEDPRDYKTKLPVDAADKMQAIDQLRTWGKGLLEAIRDGADSYGNALVLPDTEETEVEGCVEVTTPRGHKLRLRGFIDLVFEDGSIGDLKLASDYFKAIWTLARAISEHQPAMYAKMTGMTTFRYLIVDKKKARDNSAYPPVVRTIDFEVTEADFERLLKDLDELVMVSDLLNDYENGLFSPNPEYNCQTKATAGDTKANFCGKMCDFKDIGYNENFKR